MTTETLRFLAGVGVGVLLGLCIAWVGIHLLTAPAFWRRPGA